MSEYSRSKGYILPGVIVGAVLAAVFVGGFAAGAVVERSQSQSPVTSDPNIRDFLSAYQLVTQRSYYRPFDKHRLMYAAIDGMLQATGDPHTIFLSPTDNRAAQSELNGSSFTGIGAMVAPVRQGLEIVAPLPRTPAARAGIRPGDIVTKIDGTPLTHLSGNSAIARIHGPAGSVVHLTVVRGGTQPFVVAVKRAVIPPTTAYPRMLGHGLGYVAILSFGDTTENEVAQSLAFVTAHGARSVILDLRDNPGGYVDAAQHVVSEFMSRGTVAYERGTNKNLTPLNVVHEPRVYHQPLAILVNGGTASAAEITAAALRDNGRAVLLGTRTYGKGSMQSVYPLADGSTIRITDRLWLTPHKHSIQAVGLKPDETVQDAIGAQVSGRDPQLAAAERYLLSHRSS